MSFFELVGKNILDILENKNLSQTDIANGIGVSKQVMSKIVKGQKAINALELKNIAEFLNVPIENLIEENVDLVNKEPVFLFMGRISEKSQPEFKFLQSIIKELSKMEEVLDERS